MEVAEDFEGRNLPAYRYTTIYVYTLRALVKSVG